MPPGMELDNEYRPLLEAPPPQNYQPDYWRRLWQISVLMSSFLSVMASSGFNYGIAGAITEQMTHRFGVSVSESSWTSSVHTAIFFFISPLAGVLGRWISLRKLQLTGAVLSALGVGLCYFASQAWHVTLMFGIVSGIGFSFTVSAAVAIQAYHFDKKNLHLAVGFAITGFCFGILVYPVPTTYLYSTYGFNKTMLLLSSVSGLHVFGCIFYSQHDINNRVSEESGAEGKTVAESVKSIATSAKVWVFVATGFFRKVGLTAFFVLINTYMVRSTSLTLQEAAEGVTLTRVFSIVGLILIQLISIKLGHCGLIPHGMTSITQGVAMVALTLINQKSSYLVIMSVTGLAYGAQIAYVAAVAQELVGAQDMVLAYSLEMFMQGAGGLIGGPVAAKLQSSHVSGKTGLYLSSIGCFIAGILIILMAGHKYCTQSKK